MNKAPGPDCISAEHSLYADESLRFFLSELFNMYIVHGYQFLFKHNNSSHMQKQEWEYVWHFKLQTSRSSHSGVKAAWALYFI